ncbi:DUF5004 domain-containing protein [Flavobacterium procerum]|uniref:DUF5004 domain-containing protein n=1 Tax=Flavobacterium procerum TaxID=1455569 RepID=UPI0035E5CAF6
MRCKSIYWIAFMLCFSAIGCDNTEDGSYVDPITIYEKVNGNWGLTNLKMVDEAAKANKIEPSEENLSIYFNYEDFKNQLQRRRKKQTDKLSGNRKCPSFICSKGLLGTEFRFSADQC